MKAFRYNKRKPKLGYILYLKKAVTLICRIFEGGEHKYNKLNWRLGGRDTDEYIDSAMRHLIAFRNGEDLDPEFGTHHVGHAVWNLMVWLEFTDVSLWDEKHFWKQMKKFDKIKKGDKNARSK
jgi:hypothetical protein